MITQGQIAPDFTLPRDGGGTVTLSDLRPGKVVLYFYPKDDTPGCTLEAQDFTARLADFTAANLWGPAGMEDDAFWIADGPQGVGRELSGMGFNARLRDYGRLGQLMLDDGMRDKTRVLPAGWMKQATTMIPFARPTPFGGKGYGFQFWQLDGETGAYSALGLAGQFIYVHPATRTVIVKLSHFPFPEPADVMPETLAYFHTLTAR